MDKRLLTISELELDLTVALREDRGDDACGRFALMRVLNGPQLVVDLFDVLVVAERARRVREEANRWRVQ